jgi:hypothetical protein
LWYLKIVEKNHKTTFSLYEYINYNKTRIDYKEYRRKGFFVGSGVAESANKVVMQSRIKRSGQRWGLKNAQYFLALRSKQESDGLWEQEVAIPFREKYVPDFGRKYRK